MLCKAATVLFGGGLNPLMLKPASSGSVRLVFSSSGNRPQDVSSFVSAGCVHGDSRVTIS